NDRKTSRADLVEDFVFADLVHWIPQPRAAAGSLTPTRVGAMGLVGVGLENPAMPSLESSVEVSGYLRFLI
ncbi:MAG: hypothetical protein AAF394_17690, partial [Planctomycetota bacterium]